MDDLEAAAENLERSLEINERSARSGAPHNSLLWVVPTWRKVTPELREVLQPELPHLTDHRKNNKQALGATAGLLAFTRW